MSTPARDDASDGPVPTAVSSKFEPWFLIAIAVGFALRIFFAFATPGTLDVDVWKLHTMALEKQGLISYYLGGALIFNHPPPAAWLVSTLDTIANAINIPFAAALRLPFVFFDLASVGLIVRLLAGTPRARMLAACYWLHPLSIIYSSYHGNTDTSVAFFLLATTLLISQNKGLQAGVVLGLSLWLKIPGILAGPVFFFALVDLKERARFCLALAATVLVGFIPALFSNARAVVDAVFLYPGLNIHTGSGIAIWGLRNFYPNIESLPSWMRLSYLDFTQATADYNTLICVIPIILFAWLRRNDRTGISIATSVAGSFALFYGLTSSWAFQYLAWSLPFWLLAPRWFAVSSSLTATFYVYGAYAWLCGDVFLMGTWDFIGKPDWPSWLIMARNSANLFFLGAGLHLLLRSIKSQRMRA